MPRERPGLLEEELSRAIIGAFYDVYNALGFGFLEHVYVLALEYELRKRGHTVLREYSVPIYYDGMLLTSQRLDMVIDGKIIVEIKSSSVLPATARRQVYNYLRATGLQVGLVLHFGPEPRFYREVAPKETRAVAS